MIVSTPYKWNCTTVFPLPRERQEIKQFYLELEHGPQFFFSGIQVCFLIYILHKKIQICHTNMFSRLQIAKIIQICFINYDLQKKHTNMFPQLQFAKNIQICFLNYNLQKKHKYVFSICTFPDGNLHIQTFCDLPFLSHFLIVLKANCIFWNTNSFHFSEQGSGSTKGDQIDDAFL